MKKLLVIALVALSLTGMVGIGASGGGANVVEGASPKATYVYQMTPGQSLTEYSELGGPVTERFFDVVVVINTSASTGNLKVDVRDCCLMEDIMLGILIRPGASPVVDWGKSTSDTIPVVTLGPVPLAPRGFALAIIGYLHSPYLYPAGYWYDLYL